MNKTIHFGLDTIDDVAKMLLKIFETKTVLFYGEMGVGKTTLISALVKALSNKMNAKSPTFSIVNEYKLIDDIIYHFDFYRIKDASEALDIGFEDYLNSGHWNFIEWPEKIDVFLPNEVDVLQLKMNKYNKRTLKWSVYEEKSKIN